MTPETTYDQSTVKGRLLTFLKEKRISQSDFARLMGVAPTYIGVMRKSMPADKVNKMISIFPELSRDWLLYGEGSMYRDNSSDPMRILQDNGYIVPLLPVNAFAGNITVWSEAVKDTDCEKVISPVPCVDFAVRVSGDSMEPQFHDGTIVLIKKIDENAFIPWGHPMIVDSSNGVFLKEVYPSEKGTTHLQAKSVNPKYPPLDIPRDCVFGLYRVVSAINTFYSY